MRLKQSQQNKCLVTLETQFIFGGPVQIAFKTHDLPKQLQAAFLFIVQCFNEQCP
jgi:hypothetical protein